MKKEEKKKFRAILCYVCNREFSFKIIESHIKQCKNYFTKKNNYFGESEIFILPNEPESFKN